jgi:hypothetical protein
MFYDQHQRALLAHEPERWCRIEEWNGIGPKNAKALPEMTSWNNYDLLYLQTESDIYRVSFPDWKMIKLKVNTDDKDEWSGISTTGDGKEMIYSSVEKINKIGVIENLFK